MTKDKDRDLDDRIEIEVTDRLNAVPRGDIPDAVEKGEDFSGESEPLEEAHLAEEPVSDNARIAELEDRLLRTAAEFENYRKRTARQMDEIAKSANDRLIIEFLDVADNLDRARAHADGPADPAALKTGMDMIFNQLAALLARNNIVAIEAVGKPFDPNLHEALMQVDSDTYPEGTVAMDIAKGYQQGSRVIRHSKVGVSKGKPK
jgi:molecular chaperone GrpE